jgi:peptide/nickel transport system ATP-binding protein
VRERAPLDSPVKSTPLLDISDLVKRFPVKTPQGPGELLAVNRVSFQIYPGETIGLVGESGCGKSTLVRLLTRTLSITEGQILFSGTNLGEVAPAQMPKHPLRAKLQMVFQDAQDSLNPRFTAFDAIAEPLRLLGSDASETFIRSQVTEIATLTGLPLELLQRFPHQLSGGQKARVGIARAAVLRPLLLVLDEPTAALDVSVQVVILQLLAELQRSLGMSLLFVSHDLNVVRLLCDRILVMYLGKIVEQGSAADVFANPRHPYTRALIASIPSTGHDASRYLLPGEPQSPIRMIRNPAHERCGFYGRCPKAQSICAEQAPPLLSVTHSESHRVACHLAESFENF